MHYLCAIVSNCIAIVFAYLQALFCAVWMILCQKVIIFCTLAWTSAKLPPLFQPVWLEGNQFWSSFTHQCSLFMFLCNIFYAQKLLHYCAFLFALFCTTMYTNILHCFLNMFAQLFAVARTKLALVLLRGYPSRSSCAYLCTIVQSNILPMMMLRSEIYYKINKMQQYETILSCFINRIIKW